MPTLPSIDPKTATWINFALALAGAAIAYLANYKLPVDSNTAAHIQEWAKYTAGFGAAMVAVANAYLHAVSSDKPGPLAK
jgi:hypothetical protein